MRENTNQEPMSEEAKRGESGVLQSLPGKEPG